MNFMKYKQSFIYDIIKNNFWLIIFIFWILIVLGSMFWNIYNITSHISQMAINDNSNILFMDKHQQVEKLFFIYSIILIFGIAGIFTTRIQWLKLKESKEQLLKLSYAVEQSPNMVIITNTNGIVEYVNKKFIELTGYEPKEIIGKPSEILNFEENLFNQFMDSIATKGEWRGEIRAKRKNGEVFWESARVKPIRNSKGKITHYLSVKEDISERKMAESLLQGIALGVSSYTGIAFIRKLVLDLSKTLNIDFVLIGKLHGGDKVKSVATCFHGEILDNIEYELKGTPCENVINSKHCCYPSELQKLFPNDTMLKEMNLDSYIGSPLKSSNGQVLGIMAVLDSKPLENIKVTEYVFQIFASRAAAEMERLENEERINHLAFHDPLTALANRRLFNERLENALEKAINNKKMMAVMFIDLDRLKLINDTLGHTVGDQVLKSISQRLVKCIGEDNTLARLGGDEFALLIPSIRHENDAAILAEEIIDVIKKPLKLYEHELYITASIGIAVFPNDGVEAESLIQRADIAMYLVKENGGSNYKFYKPNMDAKKYEQLLLKNSLGRALERGEFMLYYQPKVNINTGQIIGMEALIRWQHPEWGLVAPGQFISLAEETGLIVPIGEWVIRTACLQNKAWQDEGFPPMRVGVNISVRQFKEEDFIQMVSSILNETGLDPQWLELEITESIVLLDKDFTIQMLTELCNMGIHISIDDFGTGYSSLNYLKQFPINTLKIDQTFVRDLTTNKSDAAITTAIIALAQSLNLEVIAEGVELEEQLEFLKQHQCHNMQGYFFGKPMEDKEFEKIIRKHNN